MLVPPFSLYVYFDKLFFDNKFEINVNINNVDYTQGGKFEYQTYFCKGNKCTILLEPLQHSGTFLWPAILVKISVETCYMYLDVSIRVQD